MGSIAVSIEMDCVAVIRVLIVVRNVLMIPILMIIDVSFIGVSSIRVIVSVLILMRVSMTDVLMINMAIRMPVSMIVRVGVTVGSVRVPVTMRNILMRTIPMSTIAVIVVTSIGVLVVMSNVVVTTNVLQRFRDPGEEVGNGLYPDRW